MSHIRILLIVMLTFAGTALGEIPEPNFHPQTIDDAISVGYGVAVGDVDGDEQPDILLADSRQIVWYRNPGEAGQPWDKHVMAENLTDADNVCIAARDINGDGKVEVAIGAQWNPSETADVERSGAVFYLHRPDDPTQRWEARQIKPHDPTTHRMRWVKAAAEQFRLVVLPLNPKTDGDGEAAGDGVRVQVVTPPDNLAEGEWASTFVETGMSGTHNLDVVVLPQGNEHVLVIGREGIGAVVDLSVAEPTMAAPPPFLSEPGGEIRFRMAEREEEVAMATIEPMHGPRVVAYTSGADPQEPVRHVLDDRLNQGHALGVADFLGIGPPQIVAGWRMPDAENQVGIRLYVPLDESGTNWATHTLDDNQMAAEDLAIADLDGDGRLDIVASGRATRNVIIYWNGRE